MLGTATVLLTKMVLVEGLEPITIALTEQHSTNWAIPAILASVTGIEPATRRSSVKGCRSIPAPSPQTHIFKEHLHKKGGVFWLRQIIAFLRYLRRQNIFRIDPGFFVHCLYRLVFHVNLSLSHYTLYLWYFPLSFFIFLQKIQNFNCTGYIFHLRISLLDVFEKPPVVVYCSRVFSVLWQIKITYYFFKFFFQQNNFQNANLRFVSLQTL